MIKYELICKSCKHLFESWFASSAEYEKLKKKSFLSCLKCDSKKIEKNLMAPKLIKNSSKQNIVEKNFKNKNIETQIRKYQKFIKDNFKYVGENFAYEARSIHYDNKKKDKAIYGTASNDEIKELKEEGIDTNIIPWIENKNN